MREFVEHPEPFRGRATSEDDAFSAQSVALAGKRGAIDTLARELRADMVEHAQAHLGRLDCDAEDVVQDVFLALLEGHLPPAPEGESAVVWLLQIIESKARRSR